MKKKAFLPIILSLLFCFCLIFSACSKSTTLNFDENSTVNLKYTCADEKKNFDTELNAEQAYKLILSLNTVSYSEINDKDVDLEPSYDSLMIKINTESLLLYDVAYKINNVGYFHFNGKLCKSKGKFGFLDTYLLEYYPDIIADSVPFGVQYAKSTVGAEESYQIIKSVSQLDNYIANEIQNINLPGIVLFKDEVIAKYNDEYFKNSFLVIFMKAAGSGSFNFRVNNAYISVNRLIIPYEIVLPEGYGKDVLVTYDIAYWYSFIELSNEYNTIQKVDLISIQADK